MAEQASQDCVVTESIDRLFLELSQFTRATTRKESMLKVQVMTLLAAIQPFAELFSSTNGRIPYERLSAADWHKLATAYESIGRAER